MALNTLLTGVSGLQAESSAMSVVGDNIANANTTGFKSQRSVFQDALAQSGGGGSAEGIGVQFGSSQQVFTQGSLVNTGVSTDVAISGEGFFVVDGSINGMTGRFYTRAGELSVNSQGELVNATGMSVLGRVTQSDGTLAAGASPLTVPAGAIPAQATGSVAVTANLDARASASAEGFDPNAVVLQGSVTSTTLVYDSMGKAHPLEIHFVKTEDGHWEYHAVVSGQDVTPVEPGMKEVGNGSLSFNSDGSLQTVSKGNPAISVTFTGMVAAQPIDVGFGSATADGGSGKDGVTQYASNGNTSSISQDGYAPGSLSGIKITDEGDVEGTYTNGESRSVGQLSIAKFRNSEGLARAGDNMWMATNESGDAVLGSAGSGGRGALTSGALESSNIDMGEEFVAMIQHQRAYSANSKTIQTADDMLSSLMMLKR
jgi:flagellar hook protein FlgE